MYRSRVKVGGVHTIQCYHEAGVSRVLTHAGAVIVDHEVVVLTTDSMAKSDRSVAHQKVARPLCTWSASKRHNPPCLPVFADSPSVVTSTSFVSLPPVRSKALFTASSSQGAPFFSGECMTTNTLVVAVRFRGHMVNDPFQPITTVRPDAACDCYSAIFRTFLCHLLILLTCCA